jgi:hypothetical protein
VRPAGFGRYPEDAFGAVLVGVFGVGAFSDPGFELRVVLLEGVGDVLQEDQAEDDVFVLGGVHSSSQGVGGLPQFDLEASGGDGAISLRLGCPVFGTHAFEGILAGAQPSTVRLDEARSPWENVCLDDLQSNLVSNRFYIEALSLSLMTRTSLKRKLTLSL